MSDAKKKLSASSINTPSHRRISIVGAGIAGLTLACLLQKQNIPFSIYEARSADSIGHSYSITLFRRPWRNFVNRVADNHSTFRQDNAVDRLIGGTGKVTDQSPESSAAFQAVDRDVRLWLVHRLQEQGIKINWNHKLSSISKAQDEDGAALSFEEKEEVHADIIIDAGGLRSPAFDYHITSKAQPKLLPYATYYGSRRMKSDDFSNNFEHYFRTGNTIQLEPESPEVPFIQIKKVHMPGKDGDSHTVELRWVYSRPAREGEDPLYRPNRTPEEAKNIPDEFYKEILSTAEQHFSKKQRSMLKSFFSLSNLHKDRILNWHLRLRLPQQEYFADNSNKGSYQVIAIGDAAHGLPIVESQGAGVATEDATDLARWLQNLVSGHSDRSPEEENYYARPDVYRGWFKRAIQAVQRLRRCHGQSQLSKSELQEILGFWVDGVDVEQMDSDSSSSASESEKPQQDKGRL